MSLVGHFARYFSGLVALFSAAIAIAEPAPVIGPPPAWVRESRVPAPNPSRKDLPLQMLLSSSQQKLGPGGAEIYVRTVAVPQTTGGLQMIGNISIPWNSERADLTIHHVLLKRGNEVTDLLKSQELTVLRRENNLENNMLDGVRTVVLQAPGLQVGDQVDLAFTQKERAGTIGARPEAMISTEALPFGLIERRFLVEDGVAFSWKSDPSLGEVRKSKSGRMTEFTLTKVNFEPRKIPGDAPLAARIPLMQISSYPGWQDVAAIMRPLFEKARKPAPDSPLLGEADAIARANPTPEAKLLAALRLAQEKVRYVAMLLGEGTHIPATADQTWSRRFGDCKGKTAMLLALLDRLGIAAQPMLTSSAASELLGERLPSLYIFDHVLVKAEVNGQTYILDPTQFGQRTLEELRSPAIEAGLPLDAAGLFQVAKAPLATPLNSTDLVWDASNGFDQQVPFTATVTYRGSSASLMRAVQAGAPDKSALEGFLKKAITSIDDEYLTISSIEPEGSKGEYVVKFDGKAPMEWNNKPGKAGREYRFDHSVAYWKPGFDRSEPQWKDLPVALAFPYWTHSSETIVLPAKGKGFTLRAQPIDRTVAGSSIRRVVTLVDGRATAVADFRRLVPMISATEARGADSAMKPINDDAAYVVAPDEYSVSRSEMKAILKEAAPEFDDLLRRSRLLMNENYRSQAIAELDKAMKLDPDRPEAPALQAINYTYAEKLPQAREKLALATKLAPDNWDVLRAQALVAWRDFDSDLALKSISRAIERDPNYGWQFDLRARIEAGIGQYDEALRDANRAAELSGKASAYAFVAQVEAASGKLESALLTLDKAEKSVEPDFGFIATLRGDYLARLGKAEEARTHYLAAQKGARESILKAIADESYGKMDMQDIELQILVMTRSYAEAAPLADRKIAAQRYPSASNLARRAMVRVMTGNYEGARKDARAAIDLDPTSDEAALAMVLADLRTGRPGEAEARATKALAGQQSNPVMFYSRYLARRAMGKSADAEADLRKARQLQFDIMLTPMFLGLDPVQMPAPASAALAK